MPSASTRPSSKSAIALLLLLPALLLFDSLFGGRAYLPFDIAEFPPIGDALSVEQRQAMRSTANYDATEAPVWFRTELQLARTALQAGHLPLWNGQVRGGAPMLPHGHLGLLNPLHWPALLFADPNHGLLCLTYSMLALAGLLMYGLLRTVPLSRLAATFGAVAFAWSGTMTANAHWFMRLEPLALLPGLLWALLALSRQNGHARLPAAIGVALSLAGIWLSGFPQYGIPTTLLGAGFALTLLLPAWRQSPRAAAAFLLWALAAGLTGLLLAMPQLLPMLEFYPLSNRPIDESLDRASRHAWSAAGFLGYLFPGLFSQPGDITLPQAAAPLPYLWFDLRHWDNGKALLPNYNFTEYALFPGTLPLLFALLALLRGPRWRWLPCAGLALLWLLATGACGAHLAYGLPGIKTVPPYRFIGPACALLAMLGALGVERLRELDLAPTLRRLGQFALLGAGICFLLAPTVTPTTEQDPWLQSIVARNGAAYAAEHGIPEAEITPAAALRLLFTVPDREDLARTHDAVALGKQRLAHSLHSGGRRWLAVGLALVLLSYCRRRSALAIAIVGLTLTAAELWLVGQPLNRGQLLPHAHDSEVHQFLRQQRDAAPLGGLLIARGVGGAGAWNLPGGTLASERIRDLNFYTFVDRWSDLAIRKLYGDQQILRGFVCDALPDDARLELPLWDLLGLRFVLNTQPMQHAGELALHLDREKPYFVYERKHAVPRAYFVPNLVAVADESECIQRLTSPELAPRREVLIAASDALHLATVGATQACATRQVQVLADNAAELTLQVSAGAPGYLVLTDTYFPGWQLTRDDQAHPYYRANLSQRVIAMDGGPAILRFTYQPLGWHLGLTLGGVGLFVLLAALLWLLRRRSCQSA